MNLQDGEIYYINFKGNLGSEINNIHLGIIFKLHNIKNIIFCVPLTSPKLKHFKTAEDFKIRNFKNILHFNWQYIKQTDSIAMLDQIKTISINRLLKAYKGNSKKTVKLDDNTILLLKSKIIKYINLVIKKSSK